MQMGLYTFDQLMRFIWPGLLTAQSMYVAARLGIADLIASGPKTVDELAQASRTDPRALQRLLRVLETIGLFAQDGRGKVYNTAMGELFRSNHPASVRNSLMTNLAPSFWRPLGELEESIRTGRPSFQAIFGKTFFDWLRDDPAEAEKFAAAMNAATAAITPIILGAYDFSQSQTIVDVGGGHGALLIGILSAYPGLRGVLYDLPVMTDGAEAMRTGPLGPRCEIVSGSFFDFVPAHGGTYILRSVLHDWDDAQAATILRNCRRAMARGRTLLVIEGILEKGSQQELLDLHMLVLTGGRERSVPDFQYLLHDAGFEILRVVRTSGPAIIESRAV